MSPGGMFRRLGVLMLGSLLAGAMSVGAVNQPVSVNSSGTAMGNNYSTVDDQWCAWWCEPLEHRNRISNDGRFVVFGSHASDLAAPDFSGNRDIFRRDLVDGTTELISIRADGGAAGNSDSFDAAVSGDGRFVAFMSFSQNLVTGIGYYGYSNIFVRDTLNDTTTLATMNAAGNATGNYYSQQPDLSASGDVVVFVSGSTNLDTLSHCGSYPQVYAKNLTTGVLSLVSANTSGNAGCYEAHHPAVSDDGRYVTFMSYGNDLVAGATTGTWRIFVRDLQTNTTSLVDDTSSGNLQPNGHSYYPSISADGRFVAFQSTSSNLVASDTNGNPDVYVRDLQTNTTELISINAAGDGPGNSSSELPTISADGNSVIFHSYSSNFGPAMGNGQRQLYIRARDAGTTSLVSRPDDGSSGANNPAYTATVSGDGRYVAFYSHATNITPVVDSNGSWADVFVRDTVLDVTKLSSIRHNYDFSGSGESIHPFVSRDGSRLAYMSTAFDLTELPDNQGNWDVFADTPAFVRGSPRFAASAYTVQEGITSAAVTVERVGGRDGNLTVELTSSDDTASAGSDYSATTATVTFRNGEHLPKTVYIPISDDILSEGDETLTVTLSNPLPGDAVLGTPSTATVSIIDNDELPTLYISDVTKYEGNSGTSTMAFKVRLPAASGREVTVDYATNDLTASGGSDYVTTNGTLTFSAGEIEKTISVTLNGDAAIEPTETFEVVLSNAVAAIIGEGEGVGTIVDDDGSTASVGILISDAYVTEGNSGTQNMTFNVTLTSPSTETVTVDWSTVAATAGSSDFVAADDTVSFAPNATSATITVAINGDTAVEGDEVFFVNLSNPQFAVLFGNQGIGHILNNDVPPPMPRASISDATLVEGNSSTSAMSFTVTLSMASTESVDVDYSTSGVTATSGDDFDAASSTVTFAPSEVAKTITVDIHGDSTVEANEVFFVNIDSVTNGVIGDNQGVGVIENDDAAPVRPSVSITDSSVAEGNSSNSTHTFTVSLSEATTVPVSVQWSTAASSAREGDDFVAASGTLEFAAGDTSENVNVTAVADVVNEGDEFFTVNLSLATNATLLDNQAMALIVNDDAAIPSVFVSDASGNEGNSSTTPLSFDVSLSYAAAEAVTVHYSTSAATADSSDFADASGSVVFAAGEVTKSVTVNVTGDTAQEQNELFFVNINSTAPVSDRQGTGVIVNDDTDPVVPVMTVGDISAVEGNSDSTVQFTVRLSEATTRAVSVDYAFGGMSAEAGLDFSGVSGSLSFAAGETTKAVSVTISGDSNVEPNEIFSLNLSGVVNALLGDNQALATIVNDDVAPVVPSIRVSDASLFEGDSGTTAATFTVWLSAATSNSVTVNYATASMTAQAGSDFTATSNSVTFAAGETSQVVNVSILGDGVVESDELFALNLTGAVNGTLADDQAIGVILNDDIAPVVPTITIGDVTAAEGTGGNTLFTFTVSLSQTTTNAVSVNYATAAMTANSGDDFTAASGTLNFAAGESTKTVGVNVIGDTTIEPNELFAVNLSSPSNAVFGDNQAIGTIVNDDSGVVLSIGDAVVKEGDSGHSMASFVVSLSAPSTQVVSVSYETSNGTATGVLRQRMNATAQSDYQIASGTITLPAGATSATIQVAVGGDLANEATETFNLQLSNPLNATIADGAGVGTILDNDPLPQLSISDVSIMEGNGGTVTVQVPVVVTPVSGRNITLNFATGDITAGTSDYTPASGLVTIPAGETVAYVSVGIKPNSIVEDDKIFLVTISNPDFATTADDRAFVTISNDDGAAIIVTPTALSLGENGGSASFRVVLNSQPLGSVVIPVSSSDTATGTVNVSQLWFDGSDWSAPKEVTVTAVDDAVEQQDAVFTIVLGAAVSGDGHYHGMNPADVTATSIDDELSPAVVSLTPASVAANGGTITINGINFSDGATVSIGGTNAGAVVFVDGSTLTVTVPALPPGMLYDVTVTNPDGFSGSGQRALFVDFVDVPESHIFHDWIERMYRGGITVGCGNGRFCVDDAVTQAQMAVFLLTGKHGLGFTPPAATGTVYSDVSASSFAASWIEQLFREGIANGCGGTSFCPDSMVTRSDMAVMLLKAKHGRSYVPPPATGLFGDVLATDPRAPWIEQLYNEGITAGCGGGKFCPDSPNTRGEMSVFILTTFQ